MIEDFDGCYRAVASRDERFDGWFVTGVQTTGIYCRPSCPARTPKRANVRFFSTAAAAQHAGFRACRRCRPDAVPGSPQWSTRSDVVARAMRLVADGVVDRDGVSGLSRRLGYSERQVHRHLVAELGTGAIALARAQRAHTARILLETTAMPLAEVAFAAGFASVRQFNDTIQAVFATTPTALRGSRSAPAAPGGITLRLAYRRPLAWTALLRFFASRAVAGVEEVRDSTYRRTLRLPHGPATVALSDGGGHVVCRLRLEDPRDLAVAVARCRAMLDLDADPEAVDEVLGCDPGLRRSVARWPGLRVPARPDGEEAVVRAVLGQQISVRGAATITARLVRQLGKPLTSPDGALTHTFPPLEAVVDADLSDIGLPAARARTLAAVARRVVDGTVPVHGGADRAASVAALLSVPGIGPWTASYVAMRGLRDPDAFPATDLGLGKAAQRLGIPVDALETESRRWRPWRAYAAQHLWSMLEE